MGDSHPELSRAMRALGVVVTGYERMSALSGRGRPPVAPVQRAVPLAVRAVTPEARDVVSLRLERPDGGPLPPWLPGAHLDVVLPSGRLRQYSLTGDPGDPSGYTVAVRRIADGGGGSIEVHALRPGDVVTVRGPRNAFPFIPVERYLFVAGGIGITPIRPMLRDAIARGTDWQFVYTGRTRASMPFLDELVGLDAARVHVWPDDECGVPSGRRIVDLAPAGAALYCCGPPPMIDAIRAEIPAEHISTLHVERFSPPPVVGGRAFEIELARTGRVVPVGAEQSALAALRTVLPDIAYSCRQGFCGTCPVRVLGGEVEHHDRFLTDEGRRDRMAVCVSRGVGRIALDL